jgi:hypothetical protein
VIDLDRDSLDRVLPSAPVPAGWDDVLSHSRVREGRRRRRLVVLAAVMLMAVGTASAFGVRALILDEGFIGVPPDGAIPSTPESGELVLSYAGRPAATEGNMFWAFLYADGRLIWGREGPLEHLQGTTGFLEQRLTPEGVELLLSAAISTGLFDHGLFVDDANLLYPDRFRDGWSGPSVRIGNRLVAVEGWFGGPTPELESALERLGARLVDPGSWLPASAWEDREIKGYVPSRYKVCMGGGPEYADASQFLELSEVLTGLPAAAADLLREAEWTVDESTYADGRPINGYCSDIATEKARAIAKALDDAGLERVQPDRVQAYRFIVPSWKGVIPWHGVIDFATYLPHGVTTCETCG